MAYRKYSGFSNATNTASAANVMYNIMGATTFRLRLYDWISGSDATPADSATKLAFQRTTAQGSVQSTVTAAPLDPADSASLAVYQVFFSAQPTITATTTVLQVAQNQRATFRWVAAPDGEIVVPATATNGLSLLSLIASATANYAWTNHWIQ